MRVALIYPPLLDPTAGYHSLSYLKTFAAQQRDDDIRVIDASIEAVCHVTAPDVVDATVARLGVRRESLLSRIDGPEDPDPRELADLMLLDAFDPAELQAALRVLRDPELFYDYPSYRWAVERLVLWMTLAGTQGVPGQFRDGFLLRWRKLRPSRVADLTDATLLERFNRPFQDYYDRVLLPRLRDMAPSVVGLNLTFTSQTPFALWLLRLLRRDLPDAHLTCGGTELSDIWKYLGDRSRFFDIFDAADSCVVGEGESAFVRLLDAVERGSLHGLGDGVRIHPRHRVPETLPAYGYERLATIPTPDLSDLPFDKYLSPHPYVYYSPSRGCYWNKCTFCDYGLNNDSPTSPWRQDPAEKVVEDLATISRTARYVYLSVDVLAPATLLRVAEGLIRRGVDVRWGAELRLEKYWSAEKCRLLRDSGCAALSVGFESANQRVLDLINKGVTVPRVLETLENMAEAGIPIQMMGFTGFPTETFDEAMDSVRFLQEHRHLWSVGGLGEFVLTSGAIVAKRGEEFGISDIRPVDGADIHRELVYRSPVELTEEEQCALREGKLTLGVGAFGRPWLGGTDTPHSYFYHDRYGREMVRVLRTAVWRRGRRWQGRWRLNGRLVTAPAGYVLARNPEAAVCAVLEPAPAGGEHVSFVRADGVVYPLDDVTGDFLRALAEPTTLEELRERLAGVAAEHVRHMWDSALLNHLIVPAGPMPGAQRQPLADRMVMSA